jgi:Tfp pilus assembly pilus retraction ATPase PilT
MLRQDPDIIMIGEARRCQLYCIHERCRYRPSCTPLHTNASQSVNVLDFPAGEREQIRRQLAGAQAVITSACATGPEEWLPRSKFSLTHPHAQAHRGESPRQASNRREDGMLNFNQALFNLVKEGKWREGSLSRPAARRRWK